MRREACTPHRLWPGHGIRTAAVSLVEHCDGAAQGSLAALEAPREAAELDSLIQPLVDLAAQVLDMDDVVRKKKRVHDLVVGHREDLVEAAAQLLLRLLRLVGADAPDDGVHRVVGAAGVDRNPPHAALHHPLGECAGRAGVPDEVGGLVSLRAAGPVLLIHILIHRALNYVLASTVPTTP